MAMNRPADKIAKLAQLATSSDEHEAARARERAWKMIENLDLELLTTLASQRAELLHDLRVENYRLISSRERANKRTTGDLVSRAQALFGHYERVDALLAVVALLRGELPPEPSEDGISRFLGPRYRQDHDKWRDRV